MGTLMVALPSAFRHFDCSLTQHGFNNEEPALLTESEIKYFRLVKDGDDG